MAGLFLARIYKRTFASPLDRSFYSEDLGRGEEGGDECVGEERSRMGGWIRGFSLMRSDRDKPMGILGNDCVTTLHISERIKTSFL